MLNVFKVEKSLLEDVKRVTYKSQVVTLHFSDGSEVNFGDDFVTGMTLVNLEYAEVAPELFNFELLEVSVLNITCPFTQPTTGSVRLYLLKYQEEYLSK